MGNEQRVLLIIHLELNNSFDIICITSPFWGLNKECLEEMEMREVQGYLGIKERERERERERDR